MTEGSQDEFKPNVKLNGTLHHCASSKPDYAVSSTTGSSKKSVSSNDKIGSHNMKDDNDGFVHMSYLNVSYEEYESKDELKLIEQSANVKHTFTESSCQFFSPSGLQHHKQNVGSNSVSYIHTNIPYMHLNYISPFDHILECPTLSSTNSEYNGKCSSTNKSSYTSDNVHSIESSNGPSFGASTIIMNEKRGELHYQQNKHAPIKRNVKHAKVGSKMTFYDPVTFQKQFHQSEQDGHCEVRGVSVGKPPELDFSDDQLSSCRSSVLDEVSPEASGFWQL
ncbi:hypothetical protein V6N13_036627 [Hibiscus sabdariffa]